MIFRAKGSNHVRWLAICCLAIGVATAIAGSFAGYWLILGGIGIAAPGLLLLLMADSRDTSKAMEGFNKGLSKSQSNEEKKDA